MSGTPLRVVGVTEDATWNRLDEEATNYMYRNCLAEARRSYERVSDRE
jgi:hypothetical protein